MRVCSKHADHERAPPGPERATTVMRSRIPSVLSNPRRGARRLRPIVWSLAACVLLICAFLLDIGSGNEVSSSLFYVVGIAVAGWFVGRSIAVVFALLSVVGWGTAVHLVGPGFSKTSVLFWNLAVELAIYLTTAVALDRIHRGLLHERQLFDQLAVAKAALDREAQAVGDLQREMLPPRLPEVSGYEWQIHYATSSRAGGDYYDFFPLPGGRLGILLGDASGHGPQATVLMAILHALLHTTADALTTPATVLQRLGSQVARIVPAGRFATACYLVLDPSSGSIDFSLAGHPPPLLLRGAGGTLEELPLRGGPPLGLCAQGPFDAGGITMRSGDTLVLYTDGLTESVSPGRDLFGDDRLRDALMGAGSLPLDQLRARVLARLDAHRAGAALEDDLTLLMLRSVRD